MTGDLTGRILATIDAHGKSKTTVRELTGITGWTWRQRERDGDWRGHEVRAIASVLRIRVERLAAEQAPGNIPGALLCLAVCPLLTADYARHCTFRPTPGGKMFTADQLIGEIIRNVNDAEGTFRGWLDSRLANPTVTPRELVADLRRVMPAWDIAVEKTEEDYDAASAAAEICNDMEHFERYPDSPGDVGRDLNIPAHVAAHLIAAWGS